MNSTDAVIEWAWRNDRGDIRPCRDEESARVQAYMYNGEPLSRTLTTVVGDWEPRRIELPQTKGSGVFWNQGDMKGTRVATRTGSWDGLMWHHQRPGADGTSEYTDEGIRKLIGNHRYTIFEARGEQKPIGKGPNIEGDAVVGSTPEGQKDAEA